MTNHTDTPPEKEKKPYKSPEIMDYGSLAEQTQSAPLAGGGGDFGSS